MLAADHDYGVYMVRHHHEPIQGNIAVVGGQVPQLEIGDLACGREADASFGDLTEKAGSVTHANRNEVPACGPVVPAGEASGFDAIRLSV